MKKILSVIRKFPEIVVGLILLLFVFQFVWSKDNWQTGVLSTDGRGYYAYLPALIIYQDVTYQKSNAAVEAQFGNKMTHHCILKDESGHSFNKTFPGVSILLLPFFLLSMAFAWLFGFEVNGFSEPFLIGVQFSALLAALLGFYAIRKTLLLMGLSHKVAVFVAVLTLFATNVFYYATAVPSLGHIYSFCIMAWILYTAKKIGLGFQKRNWYQLALLFGLLFLIRPTNVIILILLPFVIGNTIALKSIGTHLLKHKMQFIWAIVLGGLVVAILPFLWWVQTGRPIVWSYTGEGFYWAAPQPFKVLFSFRNGLFVWTPIALLAFVGLYVAFKRMANRGLIVFAIAYFLVNLYVISAWWTHYYGGGFGHRVFVEHQVFTAVLLGCVFLYGQALLKKVVVVFSFLFCGLSIAQGIQINKGIIPQDYVNWEMYQLLFLKFDEKWKGECNATLDCRQFGTITFTDYPRPLNEANEPEVIFTAARTFGGDIIYKVPDLESSTHLFLEYNFEKIRYSSSAFNAVYLVVDGIDTAGVTQFYEAHALYHIRSEAFNEWKPLQMTLQLDRTKISEFKIYIWNQGKQAFAVKNLVTKIHHIRP